MLVVRDVCKLESYDEKPKNSGKIPPTRSRPTTTLPKKQTNKRSKLTPAVVEEHSDGPSGFDRLPDEMLEKIFSYLSLPELGRARRACSRWFTVSRRPVFWRRVDVQFSEHLSGYKLIEILPSSVTYLRLDYSKTTVPVVKGTDNLSLLSAKLRERCPNLEVLILKHISFQSTPEDEALVSSILNNFPGSLKVLILEHCYFELSIPWTKITPSSSKIEILDFVRSNGIARSDAVTIAWMLPNLKRFGVAGTVFIDDQSWCFNTVLSKIEILDLEGTLTGLETLKKIYYFGHHLKALYMCFTALEDSDLMKVGKDALPNLEVLCVQGTSVTPKGIESIVSNCKSLQKVFYSNAPDTLPLSTSNPIPCSKSHPLLFVEYCDHYKKADYMI